MKLVYFNWVYNGELAVSPMPSASDVEELAKVFTDVVAVCEIWELEYDLELWRKYGVRAYHVYARDFRAPPLVSSLRAISSVTRHGGKVLVHCVGGRGRSRAVASAYLVHKYGLSPEEALKQVGGVEVHSQEVFVEAYAELLKALGESGVEAVGVVGEKYRWGRREMHASYVTMLSARLFKQLRDLLGLSSSMLKPLLVASLLHDVGAAFGEPHEEYSYEIISSSKELAVLGEDAIKIAALVALHHRRRGNPRADARCRGVEGVVAPLAAILKIADALDHGLNQVVEDVYVELVGNSMRLKLVCAENCSLELRKTKEKSWLLEELTSRRIEVTAIHY